MTDPHRAAPHGPRQWQPPQGDGTFSGTISSPQKRSHSGTIAVVMVIVLTVLGGGGVALYLLTRDGGESAANSPQDVVRTYADAYERKEFDSVVGDACQAYQDEYGLDTSDLEGKLAAFDVEAAPAGEPDVSGRTATGYLRLELTSGGETKVADLKIKIVIEDGVWKFCGEGKA